MYKVIYSVLLIIFSLVCKAEHVNRLNVYTENLPPFQFQISPSRVDGVNINVLKQLLEAEDISYQISIYPWSRAIRMAKNDNIGALISTARTSERELQFQWVGPFLSTQSGVYLYALSKNQFQLESTDDIKDFTIGVVREDVFGKQLLSYGVPESNLISFVDNETVHQMLIMGKVDLALGSHNTMMRSIAKFGLKPHQIEQKLYIPATTGNYLALNLNVSKSLVDKLNDRLQKLRSTIDLEALAEEYQVEKPLHWQ